MKFIFHLINWLLFIAIAALSFITTSDNPTLTLLDYTFNKSQIHWIEVVLLGIFTFRVRFCLLHCAKQIILFLKSNGLI